MKKKARLDALSNVSAKNNRKRIGYEDVAISVYDEVDENTGEITTKVQANYDPEKYVVNRKVNKENIRQKTPEPFIRIDRTAAIGLEKNEKLVFYLLSELIQWEDNFIRNADGSLMSISQFAKVNGFSRSHLNTMLSALESKKRIKIIDGGNVKGIYLYSKYVWFGFEKNRNDSKLTTLSAMDLVRAFSRDTVVSNTNKESGVLGDSKYPPLISQSTMTDLLEINGVVAMADEDWLALYEMSEPWIDAENDLTDLSEINDSTDASTDLSEINEELTFEELTVLVNQVQGLFSAGEYTAAKELMAMLPEFSQERLRQIYRLELNYSEQSYTANNE